MAISITDSLNDLSRAKHALPVYAAGAAYLLCLLNGESLLRDPDTLWQIKVGQWILDHHAVPHLDIYSFTRLGAPWLSSSWLSQILFAASEATLGWLGPVLLTALAFAAAIGLLVHFIERYLDPLQSTIVAVLAATLTLHHVLARPHMLVLPLMVAWLGLLLSAVDRRMPPPYLALPLLALWANLHGSFVLGLVLVGPVALDALWDAPARARVAVGARWFGFGVAAAIACCCTPYYLNTFVGAAEILNLGQLLSVISEWAPMDFGSFHPFQPVLLALIGLGLSSGLCLSPPRTLLVLGLTWMALSHIRHIEVFAFVVPLVMVKPFSEQLLRRAGPASAVLPGRLAPALSAAAVAAAVLVTTLAYSSHHRLSLPEGYTPDRAVGVLRERGAQRVFNAYGFGGYMIWRDMQPFIDSRAELYGEKFVMAFFKAQSGREPERLQRLLEDYRIDATLLEPASAAAHLLDYLPGWRRLYADKTAVIHVRAEGASAGTGFSETTNTIADRGEASTLPLRPSLVEAGQ